MRPESLKDSMAHLLAAIDIAHREVSESIEAIRGFDGLPSRPVTNGFLCHVDALLGLASQVHRLRNTADSYVIEPMEPAA